MPVSLKPKINRKSNQKSNPKASSPRRHLLPQDSPSYPAPDNISDIDELVFYVESYNCTSSLTKESPLRSRVCRLLPSSLSSTLLLDSPDSSPLLLGSPGSSPLLRLLSSLSSPRLRPSSFSSTLLLSLRKSHCFPKSSLSSYCCTPIPPKVILF